MTLPRLALSVIGDEIGPSLEEMISCAHEHGLKRLDMRTVGGRNLLGMTKDEIINISRTLEKAGLTLDACRSYVDAHSEMKRPMYHVPHSKGVVGSAANFVLHIADRMKQEKATVN